MTLPADNTAAKQPIELGAQQSIGKSSNNNSPGNNAETPNRKRIEGKFVSHNIFNLSDRVLFKIK